MPRGEFWYCNVCEAQNHVIDGECQYCECEGSKCRRDNCSDPRHFVTFCSQHETRPSDDALPMICAACRLLLGPALRIGR